MIAQGRLVESYFGFWPEFCDARIVSFSYEDSASIHLGISYIDAKLGLAAQVQLKFSGVSDVDLTELKSENVIDSLKISGGDSINVVLEACYGLVGSFRCEAVKVLSLLPQVSGVTRKL